jgi:hypothetical protein
MYSLFLIIITFGRCPAVRYLFLDSSNLYCCGHSTGLPPMTAQADYAKSLIMESISTESTPTADWQRLMGIPAFT